MEEKQPFSRAIKLLHSKQEDSELQLLQLVDELIQKQYGKEKSVMKVLKEKPQLFSKDHVPSFLKGEDRPQTPVYLDHSSNSPGVISIPDDASSSLLELEQSFEASISSLDLTVPLPEVGPPAVEVGAEAGTVSVKSHKAGSGRKKKSAKVGGGKEPVSILDEVIAMMDTGADKKPVGNPKSAKAGGGKEPASVLDEVIAMMDTGADKKPVGNPKVGPCEGQTQVPCLLCSDGKMAKAVSCRRCKKTILVCCVEVSSSTFDPGNWCCNLCAAIRRRSFGSLAPPVDTQLSGSKKTPANSGTVSAKAHTQKHECWRRVQNPSTSSAKEKGDEHSVYRSTRSRKTLNFEKKLQNIKTTK